ncbi:hypothetical protein OnM2_016072 [Erysiphe neolycopersici]|uniref:Uncharacterized protein n=1 Tax=Erysiphe neolycopersici TaxID=212602 RepID=A0A420I588_9PEZI|nr:hypothetical protein OnM2_016072 [Erysiphe neolycopersici]
MLFVVKQNPDKFLQSCFEILLKELRLTQRALSSEFRSEKCLRDKLIYACSDIEACAYACLKPSSSLEGLCSDLRSSIISFTRIRKTNTQSSSDQVFYTDRIYRFQNENQNRSSKPPSKKKCFVCHKEGCWSNRHTEEERNHAINKFKQRFRQTLSKNINKSINQYILEFEDNQQEIFCQDELEYNSSDDTNLQNGLEVIINCAEISDDESGQRMSSDKTNIFFTSYGQINGHEIISKLNDQYVYHLITKSNVNFLKTNPFTYNTNKRHTTDKFYGIMIDTGASSWSTAGNGQYLAYKALNNNTVLDTSKSGALTVQFGIK